MTVLMLYLNYSRPQPTSLISAGIIMVIPGGSRVHQAREIYYIVGLMDKSMLNKKTTVIRKHKEQDLDQIIKIWYKSSTLAHPFLSSGFVEKVKSDMTNIYIPGSETWVYEIDNSIVGFISMIENEIGGLFVLPNNQSKGIGTKLVDYIKNFHLDLEVEVFEKNIIGRAFYDKYGFEKIKKFNHEESGTEVLRLKFKC